MTHFRCDLCSADEPIEIEVCRPYTGGQPIHVCSKCGLVYVTERRSSAEVAASWSEIYGSGGYDPAWPAVEARLTYVAEFVKQRIGVEGKSVLDIGAGDGRLLTKMTGAIWLGVEPTADPPAGWRGHWWSKMPAEEAVDVTPSADVVMLTWTLENCAEPAKVLQAAYKLTKPGGHIVVATGSRLLVPPKKRLSQYLSTNAADTHPTRFSYLTLDGMLFNAGFDPVAVNSYGDSDWLVTIARKSDPSVYLNRPPAHEAGWSDFPDMVIDFFEAWHRTWP